MSPKAMITLHLADLEPIFLKYYLRALDTDGAFVMEAYNTSSAMIDKLIAFPTPLTDKFLDSLKEDEQGNIVVSVLADSAESVQQHDILLQYPHKPRRGTVLKKSEIIKEEAADLKKQIIENLIENISDQSQVNTIVEFSSLFDLKRQIELEERIEYLKKLHSSYCIPYTLQLKHETTIAILNWR